MDKKGNVLKCTRKITGGLLNVPKWAKVEQFRK